MDTKLSEEMLDYITKTGFPVGIAHDNGKDEITIGFSKRTKEYGIAFSRDGKDGAKIRGVSRADMISYISNPSFQADMAKTMKRIKDKEEAYSKLKTSLLEELESKEMPAGEKEKIKKAILFLTKMPEYNSIVPRIGLSSRRDGEYVINRYLRVGNEYDRKKDVAIQFITRVSSPVDSNTSYKKLGLNGLIEELNGKKIDLDDVEL